MPQREPLRPGGLVVFCPRSWRSDPVKTLVIKAAEACTRHGEELVRRVWENGGRLGPVAGLKAVLRYCEVEATFEEWVAGGSVLRRPLEAGAAARTSFLLQAVQAADLCKAAAREGQGHITSVDVQEARRVLQAVSDPAKQAALRSVFAGDCVVRTMTKHWQGHDGSCACGLAPETRGHIFWECPGTVKCRLSLKAGHRHRNLAPLDMERELGLPLLDPVVEAWRADWLAPPAEPVAGWRARHLYVDAS